MSTNKTPQHILDKKKEIYQSLSEEEKQKMREAWRQKYYSLSEEQKEKYKETKKEYYAFNIEKITEQRKERYAETIICECGLEVHVPSINKHKKTLKHQRIINQEKRLKKYHKEMNDLINSLASSKVQ